MSPDLSVHRKGEHGTIVRSMAITVASCTVVRGLATMPCIACSPNSKQTLQETRQELRNCGHFLDIVAHFRRELLDGDNIERLHD